MGPHWPPGFWEAAIGMLVVETIAKIRRAYFSLGKPIKEICRELHLSRKVVRKVIRKRDVTAAGHYAAIACEAARLHFHGSSSSIFVLG